MIKFKHEPTGKSVTINTKYITSYEFQTVKGYIVLDISMSNGHTYRFDLAVLCGYRQQELESIFENIIPINNSRVQATYNITGYKVDRQKPERHFLKFKFK